MPAFESLHHAFKTPAPTCIAPNWPRSRPCAIRTLDKTHPCLSPRASIASKDPEAAPGNGRSVLLSSGRPRARINQSPARLGAVVLTHQEASERGAYDGMRIPSSHDGRCHSMKAGMPEAISAHNRSFCQCTLDNLPPFPLRFIQCCRGRRCCECIRIFGTCKASEWRFWPGP